MTAPGTASLTNVLKNRHGILNSFLAGLRPLDPDRAAFSGRAVTLRFVPLREDPRFVAFRHRVRAHLATQRRELERLQADGVLPDRAALQQSGAVPSAPAMQTTVASGNLG